MMFQIFVQEPIKHLLYHILQDKNMLPREWISVLASAKRAVFMPDIIQIIADEPFSQLKIVMECIPQQEMHIYVN